MPIMGVGTHRVKILSTAIGESSKKKTPQIEIRFENSSAPTMMMNSMALVTAVSQAIRASPRRSKPLRRR